MFYKNNRLISLLPLIVVVVALVGITIIQSFAGSTNSGGGGTVNAFVTTIAVPRRSPPRPLYLSSQLSSSSSGSGSNKRVDINPFSIDKVKGKQDNYYDVIVIGSGIGGLATASLLAEHGQKKVLVLEQHYVAGGACHTFSRRGYEFGTGVHYVGNCHKQSLEEATTNPNLRTVLNALTPPNDPIEWDQLSDEMEIVTFGDPSNRYQHVGSLGGKEEEEVTPYIQNLIDQFPQEKEAIMKFDQLIQQSTKALRLSGLMKSLPLPITRFFTRTKLWCLLPGGSSFHQMTTQTVQQTLQKLTTNKDLQALLACNFGDYGTTPARAPFLIQAAVSNAYRQGAYYPRGGPAKIAQKIITNVNANDGCDVFTKASVLRILVDDNNRVIGVQLDNDDGTIIKSNVVVSDVGILNTATKLLPEGFMKLEYDLSSTTKKEDSEQLRPSITGVNLFVGLDGDPKADYNLPNCIHWIYPSNDLSGIIERLNQIQDVEQALQLEPKEFPIFVSIPCTSDTDWSQNCPNKSVLQVLTFAPWHWFEKFASTSNKQSEEYEQVKNILASKMWERAVEVLNHNGGGDGSGATNLPKQLKDVDHYEVGTPLTFQYYYQSQRGAFYGLDNDCNRFNPQNYFLITRPNSPPNIQGLYLAGQDIVCDGVEPSTLSGVMCAAQILGRIDPFSLIATKRE